MESTFKSFDEGVAGLVERLSYTAEIIRDSVEDLPAAVVAMRGSLLSAARGSDTTTPAAPVVPVSQAPAAAPESPVIPAAESASKPPEPPKHPWQNPDWKPGRG